MVPARTSGHARKRRTPPGELRERHAAVEDVSTVLDAAARFLETRSRSVAEVRRRLASAGYRASLVDEAIEQLTRQGYLDDASFALGWVASRDRARPRGERALRSELYAKGIDRMVVDEVLASRVGSIDTAASDGEEPASADESAASRLVEKHRRALARESDPRKRRAKAYALLARNGFDPDISRRVAATLGSDDAIAPDAAADDSEA
jgi:regulatory protein